MISTIKAEMGGRDGIIVTFSDGTAAGYVVEEPLKLRPIRERIRTQAKGRSAQETK
jgi:hypothetical protein